VTGADDLVIGEQSTGLPQPECPMKQNAYTAVDVEQETARLEAEIEKVSRIGDDLTSAVDPTRLETERLLSQHSALKRLQDRLLVLKVLQRVEELCCLVEGQGGIDARNAVLAVEDVAKRYGVAKSTVYGWVHDGKIPHIKPNGRKGPLRFRFESLLKWEAEHEACVTEESE